MRPPRHRRLSVGSLRAFEAVSRNLNFRVASEELHLTQPAVSRQIRILEEEIGATLLLRSTRRVELTVAGATLLQALVPWLERLDSVVRQIQQTEGRRIVGISTFASFATRWLIPRLGEFRQAQSHIDLRVVTLDQIVDSGINSGMEIDVALRYCRPDEAPEGAVRLFDEVLTPVVSPTLLARSRRRGPPLRKPSDLAHHTLMEDSDLLPSTEYRSWFNWLRHTGLADLQPERWLYFNRAHQQIESALAGHGVALARIPLVIDLLQSGELVEPFAHVGRSRLPAPHAYWLIARPPASERAAETKALCDWILEQAARTREAMALHVDPSGTGTKPPRGADRALTTRRPR